MEMFLINLENPQLVYRPGNTVKGKVFYKSSVEEKAKGFTLELEGKVTVSLVVSEIEYDPLCNLNTCPNSPYHSHTVYPDYHESTNATVNTDVFFTSEINLLGDGKGNVTLPAGETTYPFNILLPLTNLLSSFKGQYGKVEYILRAKVKGPAGKSDYIADRKIPVEARVDLNQDPMAALPGNWSTSKTFFMDWFWCSGSGVLSMKVKLAKRGYAPGETIRAEVELNNGSSRQINDLSVELIQQVTFHIESQKLVTKLPSIVSVNKGQPVPPMESETWQAELLVPPVPPTNLGECRMISLDYTLQVVARASGLAYDLTQSCPIIIGTVPVR